MEIDDEKTSTCRVCDDEGLYNIFESEMKTNKKTMKIYIILNNFLFEKLYGPDEHSSFICGSCCDSMYNSYSFMMQVRESERILRSDEPPQRSNKRQRLELPAKQEIEPKPVIVNEASNESVFEEDEDIIEEDEEDHEQPPEQVPAVQETDICSSQSLIPVEIEVHAPQPPLKKEGAKKVVFKATAVSSEPKSILITDYKLQPVVLEKGEQKNNVTIIFLSRFITTKDENYNFDEYYALMQQQHDNNCIYSCSYCVKAFGNCELLIKHLTSCHICLLCFKIIKNGYKELSQHSKAHAHERFQCPLCNKFFAHNLYRQHIKKFHFLNIPPFVAVRPASHNCQ